MSDGHRLAQLIRQAGKQPQNEVVDIVTGEVTSVEPLKVKVESRELTESFLIVGALCKATYIGGDAFTVPEHTHTLPEYTTQSAQVPGIETDDGSHSHRVSAGTSGSAQAAPTRVMLWRGLQKGDRVLMLKVGKGQKYYILQREEGVV